MIWAGDPADKGIFIKVAPYVIYKRGGFGDWAQFSEMFGMPFREAIYEAYDDDTRNKVNQFMSEWASQQYLVHNKDVEIKIHDTGGSASSADVYDKFIAVCDAGISKTILGNTLTTEQGENGARSLGEVHANEQKGKELSDENFILSILNTKFRAVLKTFGINATGGNIWFDSTDTDWNEVQAKWNVISSVAQRVPVDDDYIYEEIGIPKPDNYDQLKAEQEEQRRLMMQQIDAEKEDSPADGDDTDDDTDNDTDDNTDEDTDKKLPKKKLSARLADFFWGSPLKGGVKWKSPHSDK